MQSSNQKNEIARETEQRHLLLRFGQGLRIISADMKKVAVLPIFLIALYILWRFKLNLLGWSADVAIPWFASLYKALMWMELTLFALAGSFFIIVLFGTPLRCRSVGRSLRRVGLVNHAGEAPTLLKVEKSKDSNVTVMEFEANGITKGNWEDKRLDLETALDIAIVKITEGESRRRILLHTMQADNLLPERLLWQDAFLNTKNFVLVLGESLLGKETVDLSRIPHILLGGSTGSGKSVLLKLLLMQCVKKGATVYIADFKGGVDFSAIWSRKCKLIIDENELLKVLKDIVEELERRKSLLRISDCRNIDEYNKRNNSKLPRIVFACDEVAEILDRTGLDKAGKDRVAAYENRLSTIARQGRAFGIHLMLATQRPDASILSGQIRNNMDFRVCGRADNVLSQIILDNTSASDQIPKDAQGRFITMDGTVFQGYLFDENTEM